MPTLRRFLERLHPAIEVYPLLSVPEAPEDTPDYRLAGVPDGLGAFSHPHQPDVFEILLTHELRGNQGKVRSHGQRGAFISHWQVDTSEFTPSSPKLILNLLQDETQMRSPCGTSQSG